jgi:hypothetical protein
MFHLGAFYYVRGINCCLFALQLRSFLGLLLFVLRFSGETLCGRFFGQSIQLIPCGFAVFYSPFPATLWFCNDSTIAFQLRVRDLSLHICQTFFPASFFALP